MMVTKKIQHGRRQGETKRKYLAEMLQNIARILTKVVMLGSRKTLDLVVTELTVTVKDVPAPQLTKSHQLLGIMQ